MLTRHPSPFAPRRSRRLAFAAAAVVLGLSACGSSASSGSAPAVTAGATATTLGTTASTAPTADHPVIHLGAAAAGTTAAGAPSPAASGPMVDSKLAVRNLTYVFDGAYPTLADSGPSWQLPPGYVPDQARLAAMAAALGVSGDVREVPADQGGGWAFGPADYSGATFTISSDALGSWWFSPAPDTTSASGSGCAYPEVVVPTNSDPTTDGATTDPATTPVVVGSDAEVPPCTEPAPPVGVPSEADAIASTKQYLTQLGYDPAAYDYQFSGDEWSADVTASLLLGGQRSPITLSIAYGGGGAISWAYGSLATPVAADTFPLAGPQAGLDRLNSQALAWLGIGAGAPGGPIRAEATDTGAPTDTAVSEVPVDTAPAPPGTLDVSAIPQPPDHCDPAQCPPDQPVIIHLNSVVLDMTMVWDADGTAWILPAYTFSNGAPEDGTYTVLAVSDGSIDVPPAVAVPLPESLPAPADSTVGDTAPVETASLPVETIATTPTS
ncbi:MAG: hypothetical protein JWN62_3592 [Acidimicrobiales bacterium]|nr:hypothetical protein [Acidimicrobiales bacterium]